MVELTGDMRIRLARLSDIREISRIEAVFKHPLTLERIRANITEANLITQVVDSKQQGILAYVAYEVQPKSIGILRLATLPEFTELAPELIAMLKQKLTASSRTQVVMYVPETFLSTQLLLKEHGFRASRVLRGFYKETQEDAFLMEFSIGGHERAGNDFPGDGSECSIEDAQGAGR